MLFRSFHCAIVLAGFHLLSAARTSTNVIRDDIIALEETNETGGPSPWVRAVLEDVGKLMWMEGAQSPFSPSVIFRKFDKDRNRHLEIDEFLKLVQSLLTEFGPKLRPSIRSEPPTIGRVSQLFEFIDKNKDGHISYDEFASAFQPVKFAPDSSRKFSASAWMHSVLYEVGSLFMLEDAQGSPKAIFRLYDTDNNNRLEKDEFAQAVRYLVLTKYISRLSSFIREQATKEHLDELFYHVNGSGNGYISYAEFAHAFQPIDRATYPQEALTKTAASPWARSVLQKVGKLLWMEDAHSSFSPSAIFRTFDKNKNGKLEVHEFLKLIKSLLTGYGARLPPLLRPEKATFARMSHLFQVIDASRDGHITYEEFMLAFQPVDRATIPQAPANLRVLVTTKFQEVSALLPELRQGALSFVNREFDRLLATLPMFSVRGEAVGMLNSSTVCACKVGGCLLDVLGARNDRAQELRDGRCCKYNKQALTLGWTKVPNRFCNSWPKAIDDMLETVRPSENSTKEECKKQMRASLSSIKDIVIGNGTQVYSDPEAELGEERLYKSITSGLPMQQCRLATNMFKVQQEAKVFFIGLDPPRRQDWKKSLKAGELFRGGDNDFCSKVLSKPDVNYLLKCKFEKQLKLAWQGAAGTFANVDADKPMNVIVASAPGVLSTSAFWESVLPALALNPPSGKIYFAATLFAPRCENLMSMIIDRIREVLLESDYRQQDASLRKWRDRPGKFFRCKDYFQYDGRPHDGRPKEGDGLSQGELYPQPGWTALQLMELDGARFTLKRLKDALFSAQELKNARFSAKDMREAGFTLKQLSNADFTAKELEDGGFEKSEVSALLESM